MKETTIRLPVAWFDVLSALRVPLLSIAVLLLLSTPVIVSGRMFSMPALVVVIVMGLLTVILIVVEVRELRPRSFTATDEVVVLHIPGTTPVQVPRQAIKTVNLLNVIPLRGGAHLRRSALEIVVDKTGVQHIRNVHWAYQVIDSTEHESVSMILGGGARRQRELDEWLRSCCVPRYAGVRDYRIDNRRLRFRPKQDDLRKIGMTSLRKRRDF